MTVSFHPDAAEELKASVLYYEETKEGLGIEFAREVFNTISLISEYPDAWHALAPHIRRCIMNRFPFGLIYRKEGDALYILAVMQLNREPGYWKRRT